MSSAQIVDTSLICRSFPKRPFREIVRENLLDTIEATLKGDVNIVSVEGNEGFGKTTLLAQFAAKHAERTLSLFVKPLSRAAYDPTNLKLDLGGQLNWLLYGKTDHLTYIDDATLGSQIYLLQRRARSHQKTYYFVVDGLQDIPKEETRAYEAILRDVLPLHISDFRFVFSGDLNAFPENISRSLESKSFPLSSFTLYETGEYLEDLAIPKSEVNELHKATRGLPGNLASVRRELTNGRTVEDLLKENDFLAMEWEKVKIAPKEEQNLLAIVAYSGRELTVTELAKIANVGDTVVMDFLRQLPIIEIDDVTDKVTFVTEAHRAYGAKQLQHLQKAAIDTLIEALTQASANDPAQTHLPDYLAQAGRFKELLDHLTPDLFTRILETNQSLYPIYRRAEMGIETSLQLNRLDTLIRFSLQKAVVAELDGAEVWRSEIEARMALRDYDSAIALAQSTVLKEDKLSLLVIITRAKWEQGLAPEQALRDQIHALYDQIDPAALGERGVDIASDLVATDPDLAVRMVEASAGTEENADALDWAFARLSIVASRRSHSHMQEADTTDMSSRIKDPAIKGFSKAASALFQDHTSNEIIALVDRLEPKNRLFFLRRWATANQEREDAGAVIDHALDILIKNVPYTPKTRDLREIASPLPAILSNKQVSHLIGRFDSIKGSVKALGTSVDYTRLELLIAEAESKYDLQAAYDRLLELSWSITETSDLSTKVECMAWFVASLSQIDSIEIIDLECDLQNQSQTTLLHDVESLLANTAEHYYLMQGAIHALARAKPNLAFKFAQSLNVEERRDLAFLRVIKTYIGQKPALMDVRFMHRTLQAIIDNDIRTEAYSISVQHLAKVAVELTPEQVKTSLQLHEQLRGIRDLFERCSACCSFYIFLKRQTTDDYSSFAANLLNLLKTTWDEIDVGWQKVDTGFKITATLADISPDVARDYLEATEQMREEIQIDSEAPALTFSACIRLAIRAFAGLLPRELNKHEDIDHLASLIDRIPTSSEQVEMWTELALRCYAYQRLDLCQRVVTERIKPLLSDTFGNEARELSILAAAPALYGAHAATGLDFIKTLPVDRQEEAYTQICQFLLSKLPASDPCNEMAGDGFLISHEQAIDLCDVVKHLTKDVSIYHYVARIADSIVLNRNQVQLTTLQKNDIARRLEEVIEERLPDARNIVHDGFKIAAHAQLARIRQERGPIWETLLTKTRNISNISDRAYVLSILAAAMPISKSSDRRKQVVSEANTLIDLLPADLERTERYTSLADYLRKSDITASKGYLRFAMESSVRATDQPKIQNDQRRIIDLAHSLDPSYAASLATLLDDDPAREYAKTTLVRHLSVLDAKRKVADQELSNLGSSIPTTDYPRMAWMSLASLNANRIGTLHAVDLQPHIEVAANLPLSSAYPILAWSIQNMVSRMADTDQAGQYIVPIFEATLLGAELAAKLAHQSLSRLRRAQKQAVKLSPSTRQVTFGPGDREKAVAFIRNWAATNAHEYIKICDPYFGRSDLELLQQIRSASPSLRFEILTSKKANREAQGPLDDFFRNYWRGSISDQLPPETEITIAGFESSGILPIHDRWILTNGAGLRLGTSYNSLGINKISEVSVLDEAEALRLEQHVDLYLYRQRRSENNERLLYTTVNL